MDWFQFSCRDLFCVNPGHASPSGGRGRAWEGKGGGVTENISKSRRENLYADETLQTWASISESFGNIWCLLLVVQSLFLSWSSRNKSSAPPTLALTVNESNRIQRSANMTKKRSFLGPEIWSIDNWLDRAGYAHHADVFVNIHVWSFENLNIGRVSTGLYFHPQDKKRAKPFLILIPEILRTSSYCTSILLSCQTPSTSTRPEHWWFGRSVPRRRFSAA